MKWCINGTFPTRKRPPKNMQSTIGNTSITPRYNSNNSSPCLGIPKEPPPAYEPEQKTDLPPDACAACPRASPAPSSSNVTSAEDKYAFLSEFDTIFVIDDSGSMAGRSWREARDALSAISTLCTSHDSDGIDVYFLNHHSPAVRSGIRASGGYFQIRDARQVHDLFEFVRPCGSTPTGSRLHSILKPYVSHISKRTGDIDSIKPVNIIVITDGCPSDDPESIIVQHAQKLDKIEAPPHQVGIQFFQVGDELGATKALRELDNGLTKQRIRDMVDTTTWNSHTSDNVKALTGDVVRRLDRASTPGSPQGVDRQ